MRCAEGGRLAPPDLLGRTALTLLAALPAGARVLFLLDAHHAIVSRGRLSESDFTLTRIVVNRLPFGDRAFDGAVVDAAGIDDASGQDPALDARAILTEVRRVLRVGGELILLTESRRVPNGWRQFRRHGFVPADRRWTAALGVAGYQSVSSLRVEADGLRLTELRRSSGVRENPTRPACHVVRCRQQPEPAPAALLDAILEILGAKLNTGVLDVRQVAIRKIGKTSIRLADEHGRQYMVRVPRSTAAAARATRNFTALQALWSDQRFPRRLQNLVPRPVLVATVNDYDCYVEECLPGTEAKPRLPGGNVWHDGAVEFITTLHTRTRFEVVVNEAVYHDAFSVPLETIRRYCDEAWARAVVDRLEDSIQQAVAGRTLALAWTHGDFFLGNCLSGPGGDLTGVVDWELFSATGLPLLDLLHCMIVASETSSHPSWQRFEQIRRYIDAPSELYRWPQVAEYLERMAVPADSVPALLRMYWVDHVANRIAARRSDPVWMRKRVYQPLGAFARIGSAAWGAGAADYGR